ncbi:hypothetical protein EDEG_03451 [Edhazardia aedis USNM 41457]|uniref:ABC-2 type transporter domain-containing protein n=1 Tax=Edhazardia aedis (strain USNM 41457) TaxID=1003232 RepID=J9D2R6_EDHAE|nr:hypothetical protein EDEG_03451 [Edhazardia aedis USNM 41457]|eukprot:EJW02091.1 hypothetical protein EDEG_03451 [Edhazardia aedis USNM 41457]
MNEKSRNPPKILDLRIVYQLFKRGKEKLGRESKLKRFIIIITLLQVLKSFFSDNFDSNHKIEKINIYFFHYIHISSLNCCLAVSLYIVYQLQNLEKDIVLNEMKEKSYTLTTFYAYNFLILTFYNAVFMFVSTIISFLVCFPKALLYFNVIMIPCISIIVSFMVSSVTFTFGDSFVGRVVEVFFILILQIIINILSLVGHEFLANTNLPKIIHYFIITTSIIFPITSIVYFTEILQLNLIIDDSKDKKHVLHVLLKLKILLEEAKLWLSQYIIPVEYVFKSSIVVITFWILIGIWVNSLRIKYQIKKMVGDPPQKTHNITLIKISSYLDILFIF